MSEPTYVALDDYLEYPPEEMERRAAALHAELKRRRTVRQFSDRPVPRSIVEECLRAAATAPSGANVQPYHFVVIGDPATKRRIRVAAEEREQAFYEHRAPEEWLALLNPLGTGPDKPFLEVAPCLIAIFVQRSGQMADGRKVKYPYAVESTGIATGTLITALHHAGLVSLPYTPSPMGFLNEILGRPANERPFLVLVVGYPAPGALVPHLTKKALAELATFI
jgi:nitroreductase